MKKKAKNQLNMYYDKEADVLYVSKGKPSAKDISEETEDEVVIRKDSKSGEIRGFTVINFSKRSSKSDLTLNFPFKITLTQ